MGFLDPWGDGTSVVSGGLSRPSASKRHRSRSRQPTEKRKKRSRSRSSSRHRSSKGHSYGPGAALGAGLSSFFGNNDSHYHKHSKSSASFFGLGADRNASRGSFFGSSKPSYYKRSSRHGFLHKTYKHLKRLLRDLTHWAKRHPWKVLIMVLMPLVTGGALAALLARFGLRLSPALERLLGLASKAVTGDAGGFMGDAVRFAGDSFSGGQTKTTVRVNDGGRATTGWEQSYSSGSGALNGTIAGVAKMFI
ncbi:uncharacterized protein J7T54_005878 [Emericellopsis cladophorae]|uniref:Uncharacterized protein n=1 Tax=Emericellopsis cladophorae TaxID=2686198 RepID=A0A9P9Y8J6_9HYPO|nr:uncharacterized protein J7T54_005878 [Emericellopsis cladophorae]KAI6785544.1 hypothetical protein J7T54_005878 [Emericellopsis cladophorae]